VQVIRDEKVTNVPVRVLGDTAPERTQITGLLRRADALVVSSSVSLLPGTLVRFGDEQGQHASDGTAPNSYRGGPDATVPASGGSPGRSNARGAGSAGSGGQQNRNQNPPADAKSAPF
jgi:hypothetical protein